MNKKYFVSKTSFWFLAKLVIYTLVIVTFWKYVYIVLLADFFINWWVNGDGPVAFVTSYWKGIQDILFNKGGVNFVLGVFEKNIKTKDGDFLYTEIKRYKVSRGGSEPYLLLKTGKRVDLNISWLTKEEQKEIEVYLQKRING